MARRFSPEVEGLLRAAGWEPGRDIGGVVAAWAAECQELDGDMHAAARAILLEFGGLTVRARGPGTTYARSTIQFDPRLAMGEADDRTQQVDAAYPIGEVDHGSCLLFAAKDGAIWSYCADRQLRLMGRDIDEAVDRILLGKEALFRGTATGGPSDIAAR